MRGMVRLLLRRLCSVAGVADRNVADRGSADVQRRQRDRGEEKDLVPDGKQRRGKPNRGFQPSKRDSRMALNQSPQKGRTQPARTEEIG